MTRHITPLAIGATVVSLALSTASFAAGSHADPTGHGPDIGTPGKSENISRSVEIIMRDNSFEPESVSVSKGETLRFVIRNEGDFVHEFNIGTAVMHTQHQKEMMMMMEHGALEADRINHDRMNMDMGGGKSMKHEDPNSVLLEPGKTAEVIWKFSTAENIEFACNVPGHYESGMVGKFSM